MYYGANSLDSLRSNIWGLVSADLKNAESLEVFSSAIKIWDPKERPCRLCKPYIYQMGFR